MNRDAIEEALRDYAALRQPDGDPELEAVRTAIMLEDLFDVTLGDSEIDQALLADPAAVAALVLRLREGV